MFKISQKVKILSLPLLGLLTALSPTAVQAYETFSVKGGSVDMALNTNSKFSRIDGTPRMSLWSRNDSDSDQQVERIAIGNGSFLLKHRTTGQCLNAHYLANGKELNVWGCNASDPDQNFDLVGLSDGSNLIRRRGTNLCVDSPTRDNGGKVHLWACDANNTNQKWRSSNTPPPNNVVVKPGIINLTFGRGYQWITSTNYKFVFQTDGNLVLYTPQGKAI